MKVGISTACFYPYTNTEDTLRIIKQTGTDLCEVFLEAECEFEEDYLINLKEIARSLEIDIYSVHPFSVSFEPFLFDRYERRRLDMEKKFRKVCRAGELLGASCYVFHGTRKTMDFPDIEETAAGMDRLCQIAGEYGIKLAWENVAWCMSSSPTFISRVIERMKEDIRFTLDIKQALRAGHDPLEYLDVFGERLINVHINDASEEFSCLLPGKGNVNIGKITQMVRGINDKIPYIIEVYNENFETLGELKQAREFVELSLK